MIEAGVETVKPEGEGTLKGRTMALVEPETRIHIHVMSLGSFTPDLLSIYYAPGLVLSTRSPMTHKNNGVLALWRTTLQCGRRSRSFSEASRRSSAIRNTRNL